MTAPTHGLSNGTGVGAVADVASVAESGATALARVLGPLAALLAEDDVVEISANPSDIGDLDVFVERFGEDPTHWGRLDREAADRFVRWCASHSGAEITQATPILSARVHGTPHRIEALVPPATESACFSIRRHVSRSVTLEEFAGQTPALSLIADAIAQRRNILVAGATGSGKTTLLNACLAHLAAIAPDTRLLTIEDTPELRPPLRNRIALRASDAAQMDRLLVSALRLAPNRIVLGEIREGAVLMTLLKAWNTGHPGGLASLHANSADEVVPRLHALAAEVMATDPTPAIMQSADVIVFVRRGRSRPMITAIRSASRSPGKTPHLENTYDIPAIH